MNRRVLILLVVLAAGCGRGAIPAATVPPTSTPDSPPSSTPTTLVSAPTTLMPASAPTEIITDGVSVTADLIRIGGLADLTGPYSSAVVDVIDSQLAFWGHLNEQGGIAGRPVELVIADTGYDLDAHVAGYHRLVDDVVMFSHSTGTEDTLAITGDLADDDRVAIPLTWYSGWSDPEVGANVAEVGSNYCVEAINMVSYLADQNEQPPVLAIATVPSDFGADGLAGLRYAADELGIDIVYDGAGALLPGVDPSEVAAAIAGSGADWTWLAADPATAMKVIATAIQLGYTGRWTGSSPTWNSRLLATQLGDYLGSNALIPSLFATPGEDVTGMDEVYSVLAAALPDRYPSEALMIGYLEYETTRQILEMAAAAGDLTPAGVVAATHRITSLSFGGISPTNLYGPDPNQSVSRATGVAWFDKTRFDAQGGLSATLGAGAVSPLAQLESFSASPLAVDFDFSEPCASL